MKKHLAFALAFLLLLLVACQKDPDVGCEKPTNDVDISRKLIIGTWDWSYSKGYARSTGKWYITNPQTDSVEKSMTFFKDGRLTIYKNRRLTTETTYKFRKMSEWSSFPGDSLEYIFTWENGTNVIWQICNDSLYLPYQFNNDAATNEVWHKK